MFLGGVCPFASVSVLGCVRLRPFQFWGASVCFRFSFGVCPFASVSVLGCVRLRPFLLSDASVRAVKTDANATSVGLVPHSCGPSSPCG